MKILLCLLSINVSLIRVQNLNPYYPSPLLGSDSLWRLGGAKFQPEDSVTAVGLKQQLIRRYHYLEYIKTMYKELKEEYTRHYFNYATLLNHGFGGLNGIPGFDGSSDLLGQSSLGLGRLGALQRQTKEKIIIQDAAQKDESRL